MSAQQTVAYDLDRNDFACFLQHVLNYKFSFRQFYCVSIYSVVWFVAFLILLFVDMIYAIIVFVSGIVSSLVMFFQPAIGLGQLLFECSGLLSQSPYAGGITVSLDDAGMKVAGPTVHQEIAWPAITAITEDERSIYLWLCPVVAQIVPKRAFSDKASEKAFWDFANARAGLESGEQVQVAPGSLWTAPAQAMGSNALSTLSETGRNEACPCGSGKKFKHCHGVLA